MIPVPKVVIMAKFNNSSTQPRTKPSPAMAGTGRSTSTGRGYTKEGAVGHVLDKKTQLYSMAVTGLLSGTFYEGEADQMSRLKTLAFEVSQADPEWVRGFLPFLRNEANMRSAPVVIACEYVRANSGNPTAQCRQVVAKACQRADEPGEILAYWTSTYGKKIPSAIKKGLADACVRLYTEYTAQKYSGVNNGSFAMADVINLVHPKPTTPEQSALFTYILDERHGHKVSDLELLPAIAERKALLAMPESDRMANLDKITEARWTWETTSSWVPGGMTAEVWEALIPTMGYMALLRNLRNFETAGVSFTASQKVCATLGNPEIIAKSRQFPYRFYQAWKNSGTVTYGAAIEEGLNRSTQNIPKLSGRTLVLVDASGSMNGGGWGYSSEKSNISPSEKAGVFAAALRAKSDCDIVSFGTNSLDITDKFNGVSILRAIDVVNKNWGLGHSTNIAGAINQHYKNHDRVIILTDLQASSTRYGGYSEMDYKVDCPIYAWDLTGNTTAMIDPDGAGTYMMSGFTDADFKKIPNIEAGNAQAWPWED